MKNECSYNINDKLLNTDCAEGRLHSAFRSAVNFLFVIKDEEILLTVLREGQPLLPDSILVPASIFLNISLQQNCGIIKRNYELYINGTKLMLYPEAACDLLLFQEYRQKEVKKAELKYFAGQISAAMEETGKKTDIERLPEQYGEALEGLIRAGMSGCRRETSEWFRQLAGAGRGLTPACDDAMTGIIAVLCAWAVNGEKAQRDAFKEFTGSIEKELRENRLTTMISRKYLICACQGRFSRPLCWLMKGIFGLGEEQPIRAIPMEALMQIARTGHSSGMDTLYGVWRALENIGAD